MRLDSVGFLWYIFLVGDGMDLSETLRDATKRDGRSLYALARAAGIDRGVLVRFMNHERELILPTASKLATALGLELRPARRRKGG